MGVPQSEWNDGTSIGDPEMVGPRRYFQEVPEPKTVKNGLHLDLDIADVSDPLPVRVAAVDAEAARLALAGATVTQRVSDHDHFHLGMRDPEGNEFDLR